jgi:curved DNA-binding protein
MEFKDYYATLGVERTATLDEIKRAYRKLARKYHPDVSKEPDAEARFKDLAEAYEALNDPERRAAYDAVGTGQQRGQDFNPPPGWDSGFEFSGRDSGGFQEMNHSDFFESLFGRGARAGRAQGPQTSTGEDHHAKIQIDLEDAYRGARRTVSLRVPVMDAQGQVRLQERQLEVNIPKGVREGQHLRLAGQGAPGLGGASPGDLYLEITLRPHPHFRVDGHDVYLDLPVAPWEAALGATVTAPTPDGSVQLTIPPGWSSGRKLRLKGKGLPGKTPGDLYAVLSIAVPSADTDAAKAAYKSLASTFPHFNPRSALEA